MRICYTSVRGHHDAVASHQKKIAAVFTALPQELLFSVAVDVYLLEIGQCVSTLASND